jgi:VIT1/CCC1 family predicted Fe2+/Mn2+ transporter
MKILHELSWLWETLGIALLAAAICITCAALICKAAKKKLSKKVLAVIGAAAFVGAILAIILIARTPMPL